MVNPHDGLPDNIKAILPPPGFCFYSGHWTDMGDDHLWVCEPCFDIVFAKGEWTAMYYHRRYFLSWESGLSGDLGGWMAGCF